MSRIKFLVVDDDPQVFDLVQQILDPTQYDCYTAADGAQGLELLAQNPPNLILLDLIMPGLSGNDMLVAIQQKGYQGPIIVSTKAGAEDKAIRAFRLGASDFVTKPLRPPELLAAIEHALEEVRLQQEKALLMNRLQMTNAELQDKVKELTLLANLGQILTGLRNTDELMEVVLNSLLDMTGADYSCLLMRDPASQKLMMAAGKNLTLVMQEQLGESVRDEMAELVLTSQEPLVAAGEGLQQFKLPRDIRAVCYVPMVAHNKPIGVLIVGNYKKRTEFTPKHAHLLRAMANYVAIGITNARLFSALDIRARNTEQALQAKDSERQALIDHLKNTIYQALVELDHDLTHSISGPLPPPSKEKLSQTQEKHRRVLHQLNELLQGTRPTRGVFRISNITPPPG
jgi:DNA-binding response OmpR family regulator